MNLAIISFKDIDVSHGVTQLLEEYDHITEPKVVHLPVLKTDTEFSQSVIRTCIDKGVKVIAYFVSADGLDHLLKQADDITISDNPVKEVLHQLNPDDVLGVVWDDSPSLHYAMHVIEDLAIDAWDITEDIEPIDTEEMFQDYSNLSSSELHDEMIGAMGYFIDLMCAFVANTVMDSLGHAIAEHLIESEGKKDINPFEEE